jgi:putative ABC transport system substrate-binding protein
VAVLFNAGNQANGAVFDAMARTAATLKVELLRIEVKSSAAIGEAFAQIARLRVDALAVEDDAMLAANAGIIAAHAIAQRLVSIGRRELAEAGGLMAYGQDNLQMYRRAAYFVDRLLKGANPADLPVEQPTRFELVVNRRTAATLGIRLAQEVLIRADRVIE